MKNYTKVILCLLAGAALTYSGCKKDSAPTQNKATTTTTTTTPSYNDVSAAVASNFSAALTGSMGGANLNEGLTPSFAGAPGASALCGFVADSSVNYTTNVGDSIKTHVTGKSKFFFDCLFGHPVGYTLVDELLTVGTAPGYSFIFNVAQGYQIKSLNDNATKLQVDGTLQAFKDFNYTNQSYKPSSEHDAFVIVGAIVDLPGSGKQGSIDAGYATFTTKGTRPDGTSWNYIGRMDFIGNNIGRLTFYGNVYLVNLTTGKIVQI